MLLAVLVDRNLSPLRLAHFFTLILLLSFIEPTSLNITRSFTREISIVKSYKVCFSFLLDYLDDGKIKKMSEEQLKALFHFLNRRDTFVCLATGDEKTLIYHTAVLVARKVKILPSNSLVVVVSPLNALIDGKRESCQRLKLKAVEMERELFDNDDTLMELKNAEVQSGNLGKHPIQVVIFKDGQSVDWNCCGEITLRSELVDLIARPINLGLSIFV